MKTTIGTSCRACFVNLVFTALASGCFGAGGEPSASFGFTDVDCVPQQNGVTTVLEGRTMSCTFRVEGSSERAITLGCEDDSGQPLDCSDASSTKLTPSGANPLPITGGFFEMDTTGLGGTTAVVVWVADDGEEQVRERITAEVLVDDGVDDPTDIRIDCNGDSDGSVVVAAGSELACALTFSDSDPGTLAWSYSVSSGPEPVNQAMPLGSADASPVSVTWRWMTDSSEAGTTWVYTFGALDGLGNTVLRDLSVSVQ